jgi:hypothetical protein
MDPDPAIFVIDLQDTNKKLIFFSAYHFLKVHLHNFSKIKSKKKTQNSFSYYFCMMIEVSGSGSATLESGLWNFLLNKMVHAAVWGGREVNEKCN